MIINDTGRRKFDASVKSFEELQASYELTY